MTFYCSIEKNEKFVLCLKFRKWKNSRSKLNEEVNFQESQILVLKHVTHETFW